MASPITQSYHQKKEYLFTIFIENIFILLSVSIFFNSNGDRINMGGVFYAPPKMGGVFYAPPIILPT
jgi:hypothetical protein